MKVINVPGRAPIKMWTDGVPVEEAAMQQLVNTSRMPFIFRNLAVMPDVHLGIGATVGSVIPTKGAVIPAAVGVDIGCGMQAFKLGMRADQLPDNLGPLRSAIESMIPVGFGDHSKPQFRRHEEISEGARLRALNPLLAKCDTRVLPHFNDSRELQNKVWDQAGSLGGGNHFIELCIDEAGDVWAMLHSGSRGIGNRIGTHFIEKARKHMDQMFINLPDKDLAYLAEGTKDFDDYVAAVEWAQDYAAANREIMQQLLLATLRGAGLPVQFDGTGVVACHHNYISREHHFGANVFVTRKGAVRARAGEWGIIPGSMGTRSYIVQGLGNPESFCSCSHGAGRVMSRTAAKKKVSLEEHIEATKGVECRKDLEVLDESPAAYKNIDQVMEAQRDLVEIRHTLKQVLCIKG
jgi:tRNA-splicing ligase RtcB